MSVWDWVRAFHAKAHATHNTEHDRLLHYFLDSLPLKESAPEQRQAALEQGRLLARRMQLPWMELFYEHWQLQTTLYAQWDYARAIERAVAAAVEARKPQYRELPQRICLHEDLIIAYAGIDPEGNAELIEGALDYMRREVTPDLECRFCVQGLRIEFDLIMGRTQAARLQAEQYAASAANVSNGNYLLDGYLFMCATAFVNGEWGDLSSTAASAEELARRNQQPRRLAIALMWQALTERKQGNELAALRLFSAAQAAAQPVQAALSPDYYAAWCAFHEVVGDVESSLAVRNEQLKMLEGKGRLRAECVCRLQQCGLLIQLKRSCATEIEAARAVARRLKVPDKYLDQLSRMESGEWDLPGPSVVY